MSGIETVAGLVLGVIPICTSALSLFNTTADKVQRYRRWKNEVETYQRTLRGVQVHLQTALIILFRLAGLSEPDFKQARRDSALPLWSNEATTAILFRVHGVAYETIENDISQIRELLIVVCKKLGLGDSFQTDDLNKAWTRSSATPTRRDVFMERLTYTLSSNQIKKLFENIEAHRQSIRLSLDDIEALSRIPSVKPDLQHPGLRAARKRACTFSDVMHKAMQCTKHTHVARVQLDVDAADLEHQSQGSSFRICLDSEQSSSLAFIEVSITGGIENNPPRKALNGTGVAYVSDICKVTAGPASEQQQWLGFLVDEQKEMRMKGIYCPLDSTSKHRRTPKGPHTFVSLSDVLCQCAIADRRPPKFMERDRRLLAIRLAICALILQSKLWTHENCSSPDIEFLTGQSIAEGPWESIDYTRAFAPHGAFCKGNNAGSAGNPRLGNKSCTLLQTLARFLIQLCLGETFDKERTQVAQTIGDRTLANEYIEHAAIQMLKDQRHGDIWPAYEQALDFCLRWSMNPKFSLDDNLEDAFENIVQPLIKEFGAFTQVTA